ncbi:MAG: NAD(P)H-dependent oxidoreductase [Stomatobaculum sp.]|nr:NAD(P)H-dependent oxidoreductase [Stomatobaculum sp.]
MNDPQLLTVVFPQEEAGEISGRLEEVLKLALDGVRNIVLTSAEETRRYFLEGEQPPGRFRPVLFVVALGRDGVNLEYMKLLRVLRENRTLLDGCAGGVVTDGESDLYTKAVSRELVFTANQSGCAFVGRPLVEGTRTLSNFSVVAQILSTDEETAYCRSAAELVREVLAFTRRGGAGAGDHFLGSGGSVHTVSEEADEAVPAHAADGRKKILVLHASIRKTSNTLALWNRTEEFLKDAPLDIRTISLQNGTLYDCAGCPYRTCLHYGEQGSCFYGGVMAEEVYPAVREADAIVMLCANYNDALSANLTAFINRLTALFRQVRFYDKALFAVVVSGYSGSDIVAEQLIAALNMNKTFFLPPRFALLETANNAGQAMKLPGIEDRIRVFAENIKKTLIQQG